MRRVYVISDATGRTGELVAFAALAQFRDLEVDTDRVPYVRKPADLEAVLVRAAEEHAVVLYTLVNPELSRLVSERSRQLGVPAVDILGPVLMRLSEYLDLEPTSQPGLLHHVEDEYFRRVEALEFAVKHDDGLGLDSTLDADVVLVGVSRASKTPVSVYLSYHGWKVANFPLVMGCDLPDILERVPPAKVVAFTIDRLVLQSVRRHRQVTLGRDASPGYADLDAIDRELAYARELCQQRSWAMIDVTHRSVEEIGAEVVRHLATTQPPARAPAAAQRRT